MRLLLIENNAFLAYDIQSSLNLLGIFSIALYATVDEAMQGSCKSYDIALLRQGFVPRQDLVNIWKLNNKLGVEHIFLTGIYGDTIQAALLKATTSLELPLHDILRLPLKHPALRLALAPYLSPNCPAVLESG